MKPVIAREEAHRDIQRHVDRYREEAGEKVALALIEEVSRIFLIIAEHPALGSLRYSYELDLQNLRYLPLRRYPFLVFYQERGDHIDIWRVLHAKRDIPSWMSNDPV